MPYWDLVNHEIKARGAYCFASALFTLILCATWYEPILWVLAAPLAARPFIFTDLTEALTAITSASMMTTWFLCIPLVFYHAWAFALPGLYVYESSRLGRAVTGLMLLFYWGATIQVIWVFPALCKFFISFECEATLEVEPKLSSYLDLFKFTSASLFLFASILLMFVALASSQSSPAFPKPPGSNNKRAHLPKGCERSEWAPPRPHAVYPHKTRGPRLESSRRMPPSLPSGTPMPPKRAVWFFLFLTHITFFLAFPSSTAPLGTLFLNRWFALYLLGALVSYETLNIGLLVLVHQRRLRIL